MESEVTLACMLILYNDLYSSFVFLFNRVLIFTPVFGLLMFGSGYGIFGKWANCESDTTQETLKLGGISGDIFGVFVSIELLFLK